MSNSPYLIINTDGGSRGNPGQAASAFIIKTKDGKSICESAVCLGIATNNEAEYIAIKLALEKVYEIYPNNFSLEVEIRTDSQVVARQLSGVYKIKLPHLQKLFTDVKRIEEKIGSVRYIHIPRGENSAADRLVNTALDNRISN